jgi:putative CocE/NonD family hydrolase
MISTNGVASFGMGMRPTYNGACDQPVTPGIPVDEDQGPAFALAAAAGAEHKCNAQFLGQYWAHMYRNSVHPLLKYSPGMVDSAAMQSGAIKASGVKILNVGGWFDASPAGALLAWQLWGGRVIIGPWAHGRVEAPSPSLLNGKLDRAALYLKWSDYTLKGKADAFAGEAPVAYYTINAPAGQEWRQAMQWPLPNARPARYYLAAGKTGTVASFNDGSLSATAPQEPAHDSYQPDYSAALFDGKYVALNRYWEGDMRTSTDLKGLTYTLPALSADVEVTGHPLITLWVTSTAADEDFFAVLEDVAADGKSTYVTDARIRASRRKVEPAPWGETGVPFHPQREGEDQPLSADQPAELAFDFIPTSYIFKAGHRIRVAIINAGGPAFQPLPGRDTARPPTISIWRSATHPSSITLPVIPAKSAATVASQGNTHE